MFNLLIRFNGSLTTKCTLSNNEPCLARPTLINLNPNEPHYYPLFLVLDRYNGNCNTFDDLSCRIYFPKITKDVNLNIFLYHNKNKWSKEISKTYFMWFHVNLMVENVIQIKSAITILTQVWKTNKTICMQRRWCLEF